MVRRSTALLLLIASLSCGGSTRQRGAEEPELEAEPTYTHAVEPEGEMCLEPPPDDPAPEPCE